MKNTRLKQNAITIAISAVLGLMGSTAIYAEEVKETDAKDIEKIQIIGSHLKGSALETSAPVQTISRADLEKIGRAYISTH